jgi:hypothetical protein
MEHKVLAKVLKSLMDKARKAAIKNATTAVETKKRRELVLLRLPAKGERPCISTAASADADEEVVENVGRGSTSMGAGIEGDCSAASLDLGGNDFVETVLQGMGGGATTKPSVMAPMLGVLGDDSSSSKGEIGGGDAPTKGCGGR